MQTKIIERYFFFGLLLSTLIFIFFIFKPFWIVLILGASFTVVLYPIYKYFNKYISSWLSAFVIVFLFALIICGPILGIGAMVFNQSQNVYHNVINNGGAENFITSINTTINNMLPEGLTFDAHEKVSSFVSFLSNNISKIFSSTFSTLFSFILMLVSIFYFLKDGKRWEKEIIKLSPLSNKDDQKIIKRLTETINGVIKGTLFVALIQGILMGIGLAIFNVPNPALWGVLTIIASLIPSVGTSIISIPAIIFLYTAGHFFNAVGLLIWAVIMVGMIDNFLSPRIIGKKIKIPSFIILFSVLGGISFLGPVGILIGPLAVSLLYTLVSIYRNEFK